MPMDPAKCEACWAGFVRSLALGDPRRAAVPDAFGFGGEGQLADELAALVLAGKKRATAACPWSTRPSGRPFQGRRPGHHPGRHGDPVASSSASPSISCRSAKSAPSSPPMRGRRWKPALLARSAHLVLWPSLRAAWRETGRQYAYPLPAFQVGLACSQRIEREAPMRRTIVETQGHRRWVRIRRA